MKFLMCPMCGASELALRDNANYLCLKCNHEFNITTQENSIKSITFESTINKSLNLPKLINCEGKELECLVLTSDKISCKGIMCSECLFLVGNYKQLLNSK